MAKNRRRRRATALRPARHTPPFKKSLGHTAGPSLDFYAPVSLPDIRQAFSTRPVRSPLIRTVLEIPQGFQPKPRRGVRQSVVVQSRATGRSSDRRTRSPFLNATMVTPQLTERALICAKRMIRKEVLFATKRTGKGAQSPRKSPSKVRC